jgi:serine protease Do
MTLRPLAFKPSLALLNSAVLATAALLVHLPVAAQPATVAPSVRGLPDFTDLVDLVGPSVVNIRTLEKASSSDAAGTDEQMLEFFRRFGIPIPPGVTPRGPRQDRGGSEEAQPRGVGSGFILSADGLIMTNAHVVEGADELVVTLPDKREFKAKIVGADKRTDVAVVKIEASGLPAVRIGDVNRLRVGEWVMAIGSPFGLENTVTAGIVSAKKRDTGDFLPFIQTDVAINPGNSGGPLINMRGEVVGINSQIYSRSGGFQGISFAIPIDEAVRVSDQLRSSGRVTRGRIGVQIDQVSKEVAESIGLGQPRGALVRGVEPNSPAAKAGVEPGDIILKFDGKEIDKSVDLPRLVGNTRPGNRSSITVFRRGGQRDLTVTVAELEAERPDRKAATPEPAKPQPSAVSQSLGLTLAELSAAQKKELDLKGGVRVSAAEGAAARAGLREGDVIVSVANTEVSGVKDFEAVVSKLDKSRAVNVLFRRGEWAQYAVIRPSR